MIQYFKKVNLVINIGILGLSLLVGITMFSLLYFNTINNFLKIPFSNIIASTSYGIIFGLTTILIGKIIECVVKTVVNYRSSKAIDNQRKPLIMSFDNKWYSRIQQCDQDGTTIYDQKGKIVQNGQIDIGNYIESHFIVINDSNRGTNTNDYSNALYQDHEGNHWFIHNHNDKFSPAQNRTKIHLNGYEISCDLVSTKMSVSGNSSVFSFSQNCAS